MKNSDFSPLFYYKTSKRVYQMYKKSLLKDLFSQCEMVAYHIVKKSKDGRLVYKSF
ncbi:hypothetical protein LGK97_08770 [Clostridium sp. CS001]|uniref:hypothetical protein n=1 Tax=Clostridium sp. CS001 TaxID=2880648 RepID=UPI001CF486D7|nr:hypothetical protein [Clostridium sp. CS001]MCB2289856.1 hypothetical protein [Clostridium sp. CS001]